MHNIHCIGKFGMAALDYPGPFCKQIGILTDSLLSDVNALPVVETKNFSKGTVLELSEFRRNNDIPWEDFHSWIEHLCAQADNSPTLHTIHVKITRLESKLKELKRNKRQDLLSKLKSEPFFESIRGKVESTNVVAVPKPAASPSFDVEVLILANQKLAAELTSTKQSFDLQQTATDKLTEKLSKLSVRNVNKKLRRRDDQIVSLKEQVKEKNKFEGRVQDAEKASKRLQVNLYNARKRCKEIDEECQELSVRSRYLNERVAGLQAALDDIGNERDCLLQKEQLTQEIVQCGLWQTHHDIVTGLGKEKSKSAKLKALKAQLNFRKKVLEQRHPDKDVFAFTRKGKQLSVDELVSNLNKLLSTAPLQDKHAAENQESLIGKTIRHKWCNEDGVEQ